MPLRRLAVVLTATSSLALGGAVLAAGPAAAGPPAELPGFGMCDNPGMAHVPVLDGKRRNLGGRCL